jgi:flagellar protein FlaF
MSKSRVATSYNSLHRQGGSPRETEGRALIEAARRMQEAARNPDDIATLRAAARLNWRLWTLFQAEISVDSCPLPVELRQNMLNLCHFVDKRTVDFLANPSPQQLTALININREIAAGLLNVPGAAAAAPAHSTSATPPAAGRIAV